MIYGLFVLFTANTILRLNDFVSGFRGFPLAEVMIPLLVGTWLVFEKKDFSIAPDWLLPFWYVFIIVGYSIVVWPQGAIDIAKGFLPWLMLYFLTANLIYTRKRQDWLSFTLLACGLVLVTHCVQQYMTFDGVDDTTGVGWSGETVYRGRSRYVGVVNDPNDLGLFFVMMLPVALQLSTVGMGIFSHLIGYLICIPLMFGIFTTNSRGAMLASGFVAFLHLYRKIGLMAAGTVCACLAAVVLAVGPSRVREQNESDDESTQGRIEAWHEGFEIFKQYPITGCGKDEFTQHHYLTAHNSFVLCFAETGFVGYVAWLGTAYFCVYGLWQVIQRVRPGTKLYRQTTMVLDSLLAFFVGGFFLSRTYYILLAVFMGLAVARYKLARDELAEIEESNAQLRPPADADEERDRWGEYVPNPAPLGDISAGAIFSKMPRLVTLSAASMAAILIIVKIKL